jgi:protein involved in polysaccharide export with SLBB domain
VVYIFGEVLNPGAVLFEPGNNINDYIDIAGGLSSYADKKSIILVQANGLAYRNKNIRNIFGEAPNSIDAGSVIYIPRDLSEIDGLQLAAVVSPIISSLALSIASINSIKN